MIASTVTKAAVLPKAGLPPQTQEPKLQFYQGRIGAVVSRCFPHPTLSLSDAKYLKRSQGTNVVVRGVDLANWALRTSPKFTTGVISVPSGFFDQIRYPEIPISLRLLINNNAY